MRSIFTLFIFFASVDAGGLLEVTWPKQTTQQEKATQSHPKALKERVKSIKLPVYLPKHYINSKISIVSDKNFYTTTIFLKGASLMISGDRTYQQKVKEEGENLKAKMKKIDAKFIHAEGMMSTSFNRHGVNYTLMIECDAPNQDRRCKKSQFLKQIYTNLLLIGGSR
jgi:hypothetical protein